MNIPLCSHGHGATAPPFGSEQVTTVACNHTYINIYISTAFALSNASNAVGVAAPLCISADRPDGAGESSARNRTFLKPSEVVSNLSRSMRFLLGFVWMPETQMMTSLAGGGLLTSLLRWIFLFIILFVFFL